jgi:hypothetical protein
VDRECGRQLPVCNHSAVALAGRIETAELDVVVTLRGVVLMSVADDSTNDGPAMAAGIQSKDGAPSTSYERTPIEWERVVEVTSLADLFATHRGAPLARYLRQGDGPMAFKGSGGGVSRRSAAARAGQVYRATTTITATGEGETAPAHFGPMFLDARDEILLHSVAVPICAFGMEQRIDVETVAPEGTVSVRLRMVGAWAEGKDTSGNVCTYGPAVLYRRKT